MTKKHLPYSFDINLSDFRLPDGFLFGVANSPYHVEGHYNEVGSPFNQWGQWELDGRVETSGLANNFWNNWQPQIDKAKALGLNAFRMGFDWTRVQPSYTPEPVPLDADPPPFDASAFDRYAEIVAAVYDAEMEPIITVYHFIQPSWVGVNLWLEPLLVDKFLTYAVTVVKEVNTRLVARDYPAIWFWVTFNEPGIPPQCNFLSCEHPHDPARVGIASALTNQDNILACHIRLYDLIHDLHEENAWRTPHVGFNTVANSLYEFDKGLYDLCRAREYGVAREDLAAHLGAQRRDFYGYYDRIATRRFGAGSAEQQHFERRKFESRHDHSPLKLWRAVDALYNAKSPRNMDYVAINIYEPFLSSVPFALPAAQVPTITEPAGRPPWSAWVNERETYEDHIELYGRDTHGLPLYILEASIGHSQAKFGEPIARPDGLSRVQYLKETLGEAVRGLQKGFPVQGYIYWTLCDNYEWGTYTVRLGLLEYDYQTNTIKDTDAFGEPTGDTLRALVGALQSSDPHELLRQFSSLTHEEVTS